MAAIRAASPVRTMCRNISRGFNGRIGLVSHCTRYSFNRRSRPNGLTRRIRRGKGGCRRLPLLVPLVSSIPGWNSLIRLNERRGPARRKPRASGTTGAIARKPPKKESLCPTVFAWTARSPS
jgi:hypothetical protein